MKKENVNNDLSRAIIFAAVLIAGALVFLGVFAFSLWKLLGAKRATYMEDYKGKSVYMLSSEDGTTHSLFNRIYLHPSHESYREIILEHEYAHFEFDGSPVNGLPSVM